MTGEATDEKEGKQRPVQCGICAKIGEPVPERWEERKETSSHVPGHGDSHVRQLGQTSLRRGIDYRGFGAANSVQGIRGVRSSHSIKGSV